MAKCVRLVLQRGKEENMANIFSTNPEITMTAAMHTKAGEASLRAEELRQNALRAEGRGDKKLANEYWYEFRRAMEKYHALAAEEV